MKITKSQLKQIIKEELESILSEQSLSRKWDRQKKRLKFSDRFGPEEVEEMAKELAKEAGHKDKTTYDWHDYKDAAKKKLTKGDLASGDN